MERADQERITFKINGEKNSVGCEVCAETTLLEYIRDGRRLPGTKYMCREAGCGACLVAAVTSPGGPLLSVNSCIVPVLSCQDWEITTIEEVGNKKDGYHPIQLKFADCNASQCGYCTPGWVMHMFSLLKSNKQLTMLELEKSFGSNLCRCTGYRPILDAIKSFASDFPKETLLSDIEDLKICDKSRKVCSKVNCEETDWCLISGNQYGIIEISLKDNRKWFLVRFVFDIFQVLNKEGNDSYMLVHGNTAKVPYPLPQYPRIIIDISKIEELQTHLIDQNLIIGAGVTITKLLDIFETVAQMANFEYLQKLYEHLTLVAHIPVRNVGSMGGNLMIKYQHNEFPSDVFLLLETVGAALTIVSNGGLRQVVRMQKFLQMNMKGKVILNAMLPPLSDENKIVTFKIMSRAQSVHATVNAGFLYKLCAAGTVYQCRITYGNLSPAFTRATATENFLKGLNLFANATVQAALVVLQNELVVTENPPEASAAFRKQLAVNLFYKGLLSLCPQNKMHPRLASGAINIHSSRPVSQARQVYDTDKSLWPLTQPLQKVEALIQSSGEATYTDDIPKILNEAYVSYVVTTVATGTIQHIDASGVLKRPGVIAFFSAQDIPGLNSYTPDNIVPYTSNEEIFCDGAVKYFNQPLGIIVAETQKIADEASELVKVTYTNVKPPIVDIRHALKDPTKVIPYSTKSATEKGTDVAKEIKHEDMIYGQYHFTMETLVCVTRPSEEGLEVYPSTQWTDAVQLMISKALKMDSNKIDVYIRRLGGGYGFKVSRPGLTAIACSLAAYKLNRPCRFVHSLRDNTRSFGKRLPCLSSWEFAVNSLGAIQYSTLNMYEDNGYKINENFYMLAIDPINNCYDNKRWNYNCYNIITDMPSNTWCRAPGTLESIAMAEFKMDRIAYELSLDPFDVRLANLDPKYNELQRMIETIKHNSDYENRRNNVNDFNAGNRWKKRGLRVSLLRWNPIYAGGMEVMISIYHGDGTVAIVHGGVEMGQGINTKAVQICAHLLSIPVEKIQIKANNTISAPNCYITGASVTSQNVCFGVKKCCDVILERLAPIMSELDNPTWEAVVTKAFETNVSLIAHGYFRAQDFETYVVYGVTVAEVEIDVLTGECEVKRVDLLQDTGQSVNPDIDIGQIEGAFIMGLGYWTCEKLVYNQQTGELLTDRAWNYHIPQARDIPQDFRVYMRKQSYSNDSAFGSKCVGEPPLCMGVVIPLAIREAITSARLDAGIPTNKWFSIDGPYNLENIGMATNTKFQHMVFY